MVFAAALYSRQTGHPDVAVARLDSLPAARRTGDMETLLHQARADSLRAQAAAEPDPHRAAELLKKAVEDDPQDPWGRLSLAIKLDDLGDAAQARAVMEHGRRLAPDRADMLYARALLAEAQSDWSAGLDSLSHIAAADQTQPMQTLKASLTVRQGRERAETLYEKGSVLTAKTEMVHAENAARGNATLEAIVAEGWAAIGENQQAITLARTAVDREDSPLGVRLALARLYERTGDDETLSAFLAMLPRSESAPADLAEIRRISIGLAVRRADALRIAGKLDQAKDVLREAERGNPEDRTVLLAKVRLLRARGEYEAAEALSQRLIAKDAKDRDAHLALAEIAADKGDLGKAVQLAAAIDSPSAASLRNRIERGRAPAMVETGVSVVGQKGATPGQSNLAQIEAPTIVHFPIGYGKREIFFRADALSIGAGKLSDNDAAARAQFGTIAALRPSLAPSGAQSGAGAALAVGYADDHWRIDIGTTPLGLPVVDVVGGVRWSRYTDSEGLSLDASRRPVNASLLSYGGARDPVTGAVWGGVRSNGFSFHLSEDIGPLAGFADFAHHWLIGRSVQGNEETTLRVGLGWLWRNDQILRLTTGVEFTEQRYDRDLRYFTFGQGGYYSPQKLTAPALVLDGWGSVGNWRYRLRGSVAAARSYESDSRWYPTNPALNDNFNFAPVFTGGSHHQLDYAMLAVADYQITPWLDLVGQTQVERTAYYRPDSFMFSLRYKFGGGDDEKGGPPGAVLPYSRY
jgi:tetratricopeptide (TPR) repeat protein